MKSIYFESVQGRNFLSVGETPVFVDFRTGLNIITGINRDKEDRQNGAGKSTVMEMIYFAIFGTTIRELKKSFIANSLNEGELCEVQLCFSVQTGEKTSNYKIIRTINPAKCFLYCDGEDITRDTINNTTSYIQDLLSLTPNIAQNCLLMSVNNTVPFMAQSKTEKRKFIEGIFNLDIFSNMLLNLRSEYNEIKMEYEVALGKYHEVERAYNTSVSQRDTFEQERKDKKKKYTQRFVGNKKEIEELKPQIESDNDDQFTQLSKKEEKLQEAVDSFELKLRAIQYKHTQIETRINVHKDSLNGIGTNEDVCPVCFREVTDEVHEHYKHEKARVEEMLSSLKEELSTLNSQRDAIEGKLTKLKTALRGLKDQRSDYELKRSEKHWAQKKYDQLVEWQKQLIEDLRSLDNSNNVYQKYVEETKERLDECEQTIDQYKKTLNLMDVVKFVVSEEGVKSYIVKQMLQLLNTKIAYYLQKLDANCICLFNEYFEEEIVDERGKECSYFNFSGAERKSIDLACLFAFLDLRRLQGDTVYNISFYDELFDTSFDERGIELILGILKERVDKYNEAVHIISHRKESVRNVTGQVIYLVKENGITQRVDYSN